MIAGIYKRVHPHTQGAAGRLTREGRHHHLLLSPHQTAS
jgi:hypothetical protein